MAKTIQAFFDFFRSGQSAAPSNIWQEFAQALRTENEKLQGLLSEITPDPANADLTELHQAAAPEYGKDNPEDTLAALRDGFETLRSPLQECCLALARYHLSLYPDHDQAPHLREAERLARIAALLCPEDRVATTLTIEIQEVIAAKHIGFDQGEPASSSLLEHSNTGHGGAGPAAENLVRLLIGRAHEHFAAGQYLIQEQLANRARLLGLHELGNDAPATLEARYQHLLALDCLGRFQAALQQTNHLLPDQERVLGAEHPDTLATRFRRVKILDDLGESENAHQEVEVLIPVQERVLGAEHPDTLATRFRRATILNRLGKHEAARQAVEELIPIQERVLGAEHPDTLSTRSRRAEILDNLEEYHNAHQAVEELIPVQERVLGMEHPDTLTTRFRRATLLDRMGKHGAARQAVEYLIPIQERVLGADHPDTLTTRFRMATILNRLGEHEAAREAVEQLLATRPSRSHTLTQRYLKATMILNDMGRYRIVHLNEAAQRPAQKHRREPISPDTLITRSRKAEILANYGQLEAAREEVEQIIPVQERAAGPEHPDTIATRALKARILAEMGERYAARMEIDLLLPIQERVLGAHHRLTQATRRLKEELTEEL